MIKIEEIFKNVIGEIRLENIENCKLNIMGKIFILKVSLIEKIEPKMIINHLPKSKVKMILFSNNFETEITIKDNQIIREKVKFVQRSDENYKGLSITFQMDENFDVITLTDTSFKSIFPELNIEVDIEKEESGLHQDTVQYMYQCQKVSESISSILSYSLNPKFRRKCHEILEYNQQNTKSLQEIIAEKLINMNKNS